MCATSSDRRWRHRPGGPPRGFTMVELIAVLLMVGALAAVALPRMDGALALRGAAWRDQVKAGLLHARALAQGHRRLTCVTLATGEIRISQAIDNPAQDCKIILTGDEGDERWAVDTHNIALAQEPAGTLYFQPDGRVTLDGAGAESVDVSIFLSGEASLQIVGGTGHVQ